VASLSLPEMRSPASAGLFLFLSTSLRHGHGDLLRRDRRIVRHVVSIAQQQLKGMLAGRQLNPHLGLARAEMQMFLVVRNWLIERRQLGIDD
jgi:hypothetical protein